MSLLYRKKQGILDIIIYEKTKSEFSYLRISNNLLFSMVYYTCKYLKKYLQSNISLGRQDIFTCE